MTAVLPRCFRFRPLARGERGVVGNVFAGLGERSRRLRFGGPKPRLAPSEVEALADVDGSSNAAVVALDCAGRPVGIARFVRDQADPEQAEVAFEVVDDWQRRGVGTRLLGELAVTARDAGVERFTALVAAGNEPSLRLLRGAGPVVGSVHQGGEVELTVELRPHGGRAAA
jgi:RimJ/RimL family protein N-acetyltransferase